jgi:hypothetical protein
MRRAVAKPSQHPAESDLEKCNLGMGGRQPDRGFAQTLMPVRAKPASVAFPPARAAATWSLFRQCAQCAPPPVCPYWGPAQNCSWSGAGSSRSS